MNPPCFSDSQLLQEIRSEFADVVRGSGTSLHETEVLDAYGSETECAKARLHDTDRHWWQVREEWLDEICGVGGPCFLDEAGYRYYLPAYMSHWLRTKKDPGSLEFHLDPQWHDYQRLFTSAQVITIAHFAASFALFEYLYWRNQPPKFFEEFWGCFW